MLAMRLSDQLIQLYRGDGVRGGREWLVIVDTCTASYTWLDAVGCLLNASLHLAQRWFDSAYRTRVDAQVRNHCGAVRLTDPFGSSQCGRPIYFCRVGTCWSLQASLSLTVYVSTTGTIQLPPHTPTLGGVASFMPAWMDSRLLLLSTVAARVPL